MVQRFGEVFTGIFMMITTAVLFSVMALFVRLSAETIPVGMIVWVRFFVSTLIIVLLWATGIVSIKPVNHKLLALRGVTASLGGVFYFFSVASISIAEAVILKYTYPFFAVLFAALLYREKTDRYTFALIVASIAGVVIMMNPAAFKLQIGYMWGILNGISAGLAVAFVKRLRNTDDSATIMFVTSVIGVFVSIPFLSGGLVVPRGAGLVYMLLASVTGLAAQFALVYGIRYIKTGSACVIMTMEVVMTSVLGYLVLGHTIGITKLIGGVMILSGGAVLMLREGKTQRSETVPSE